ncbi:hypothetical protein TSAR_006286, partial [Trichomalopsis sarcophagae]
LTFFNVGGEIQGPFETLTGVPQGCCHSHIAYNIYTHKLPDHDNNCQYLCFADDVAIFASSPDLDYCLSVLQNSLDRITSYFYSLGLTIAPKKTELIVLCRKNIDTSTASLSFGDTKIKSSPQVKLLGTPHFNLLLQGCNPHINLIRSLCGTLWGGHPQSFIQIYKAFILGSLDYGSFVFLPRDKSLRNKLEVTQRKALRACLGLCRSTPNSIVYAESCEPPLHLRQKKLALKFVLRAFVINNIPTIKSLDPLFTLLNNHNTLNFIDLPVLRAYARLKRYRPVIHSSDVLPCFIYSLDSQIFVPNTDIDLGRTIKRSPDPPKTFQLSF